MATPEGIRGLHRVRKFILVAFNTFIRSTPADLLRRYFEQCKAPLPASMNWTGSPGDRLRDLEWLVDRFDRSLRDRIHREAEQIARMADEAGQTALFGVVRDVASLEALGSGFARALTVFLDDIEGFRRAERTRYSDDLRMGRQWSGFRGQPALQVPRHGDAFRRFHAAIRQHFDTPNIHVDVYDRSRPELDGEQASLVQITVYREGRLDEEYGFVDQSLTRIARRPVLEAGIVYESDTGVTEVVGPAPEDRLELAKLFSWHMLGAMFEGEHIEAPLYTLAHLTRRHAFPTDAQDGIASVRLVMIRLVPLDTNGQRLTLECTSKSLDDIWSMSARRFGPNDPLQGGWRIDRAKLAINFLPRKDGRGGRTLPVTIALPRSCNLKDRDHDQRLIGRSYLKRWGLLLDV